MLWRKRASLLAFVSLTLAVAAFGQREQLVHRKTYAMGTLFEIAAYDASPAHASAAIDEAFKEIVRMDHVMSNYDPASDLSRLNRSAHFRAEAVPHDLYEVIRESLRYSRLSGGEFDITVGPLAAAWKAVIEGGAPPSVAEEARMRRCVGYEKISLIPPDRIEFRSPCLEVDLGAIGKGYAVDRAVDVLRAHGIRRAFISAGGSTLYGLGSPPGQTGWAVHLKDPSHRLDPLVVLRDSSVSTSEQTPSSLLGGASYGHIIDPASGNPVMTTFAVSVAARTATASDALSTALLMLGPERGSEVVREVSDVSAIWIAPGGEHRLASAGPVIALRERRNSRGK